MRHLILLITLLWATISSAQFDVSMGFFGGNQDNDNPITWGEISALGAQYGAETVGDLPQSIQDQIKDRTDGRLFGAHFAVGYSLPVVKYNLQGVDMSAGFRGSAEAFYQTTNSNYESFIVKPAVGVYAELGFRVESGIQQYSNEYNWYLDLSAPIIHLGDDQWLKVYSRYQRTNPFTDQIVSKFVNDLVPMTLESITAGVRFQF